MFGKVKRLHFVGIGGAGMSGIAEVLCNLGYHVEGSDLNESDITRYLARLGITIHTEHKATNVGQTDVVVISSAVGEDNPEVVEARRLGIPVIKRAEMLGELMRLKYSVGVAGTHGKTTTTSMVGQILRQAGMKPTIIVGGIVTGLGTGAALGKGDYLVAEADEYDRSFLAMYPTLAVVTNIEPDHLECYDGLDDLRRAFLTYMNRVPFYGSVVIPVDDANVNLVRQGIMRPYVTFGFRPEADYRALEVKLEPGRSTFAVYHRGEPLGDVILRVPGRHNIANALAATAAACELEVPFATIADALMDYRGVGRRFELVGEANQITVYDDYAHHPTEIEATLRMVREVYRQRLIVVFQPHLFSRTRDFAPEFARALSLADVCLLVDIFPAREQPMPGVTSELIAEQARRQGLKDMVCVGKKENAIPVVVSEARAGDIVILMGAGSITHIRHQILEALTKR